MPPKELKTPMSYVTNKRKSIDADAPINQALIEKTGTGSVVKKPKPSKMPSSPSSSPSSLSSSFATSSTPSPSSSSSSSFATSSTPSPSSSFATSSTPSTSSSSSSSSDFSTSSSSFSALLPSSSFSPISSALIQSHPLVKGFYYLPNFISEQEHSGLIAELTHREWCLDISRRTQHYGYKYSYESKTLQVLPLALQTFPPLCQMVATRIQNNVSLKNRVLPPGYIWDQIIVNEYTPSQGIAKHVDRTDCFGACIASLSLGQECVIDMFNPETKQTVQVPVAARSLYILSGPARYKWQHGISTKKKQAVDDQVIVRVANRISITYRSVIRK